MTYEKEKEAINMQAMNHQNQKRVYPQNSEYITMRKQDITALVHDAVEQALAQHLDNGTLQAVPITPNPALTMTVEDACAALNLCKPIVYDLTRRPDFPCFHVGKKVLINRTRLQEWIDAQCEKGAQ